ncbi:MAG: divalent-cation tolerance protein CutA [Acidimicrobiales bacterium]
MTDADKSTEPYAVVLTTTSSRDEARQIARRLLEERLAACVQLLPVESIYTWQGETIDDGEVLLVVKTRRDRYAQIERAIHDVHSYEVPEIVMVPVVDGLAAYLNWIDEATRPGAGGPLPTPPGTTSP